MLGPAVPVTPVAPVAPVAPCPALGPVFVVVEPEGAFLPGLAFCPCWSTTGGASGTELDGAPLAGWLPALLPLVPEGEVEVEGDGLGEGLLECLVEVVFGDWPLTASCAPAPATTGAVGTVGEPTGSAGSAAPSAAPVSGPPRAAAVSPPPARADNSARHTRRRRFLTGIRQSGSSCGRPMIVAGAVRPSRGLRPPTLSSADNHNPVKDW